MKKFMRKAKEIVNNKTIMKKIGFTLLILALYRLLTFVPVPFVDIDTLMNGTLESEAAGGFGYLVMLMGGALSHFSIIAIGVSPYITSSIILQLLSSVIPSLEELTEQGEVGQAKINQYTRYLTLPMAFLQGIGMTFIMNSMLGGQAIETSIGNILLVGLVLACGSLLLMRLGELITDKGLSNGISMLIFASIVSGIIQKAYTSLSTGNNLFGVLLFMILIVVVLIVLSIFILKSTKEIPVVYARSGKVQQSSILPIPMNPVGMVPIIFAMAFVSFPYLMSQLIMQFQPGNQKLMGIADWIQMNLNIYSENPGRIAIVFYIIFIVAFTFLYTLIMFSPDRMADNIQKKGGYIPGIRPGKATSSYINGILMHLCLRGGLGLALIAIYTYILNWIPGLTAIAQSLGGIPTIVAGSGIIIIVGVVQDLINKVDTELVMAKYEKY
jgi:preprotein translocase subunit SecY